MLIKKKITTQIYSEGIEDVVGIFEPKPYQEIKEPFVISGVIPKTWLKNEYGIDYRIFIESLDIDGKTFMGSSIDITPTWKWLSKFQNKIYFSRNIQLSTLSLGSLERSQGRIVIKLSGQKEDTQSIFIPLVVKLFEPKKGVDMAVEDKHRHIIEKINQHKRDLTNYYKELEIIRAKQKEEYTQNYTEDTKEGISVSDKDLLNRVSWVLRSESDEEYRLDEKYKEALDWRGRLVTGITGRMDGFVFKVYSNDHGKHFHVVHRERGVDARFSFPEIKLISYKNTRNLIGSKQAMAIHAFFQDSKNFKRLEQEFQKRD